MNYEKKIVTAIPLRELWSVGGLLSVEKVRQLDPSDLTHAFGSGPMLSPARFVVADVGKPLRWLDPAEVPSFWKNEARGRIVDSHTNQFRLEDYPGEYCFTVSEWSEVETAGPIYLFERHH